MVMVCNSFFFFRISRSVLKNARGVLCCAGSNANQVVLMCVCQRSQRQTSLVEGWRQGSTAGREGDGGFREGWL